MGQSTISIENLTAIITALVAVSGLLLSIYNFYVSRRDKQPRLVAKIANGFLAYGPELSEFMLLLEIANPGKIPVKISTVEIAWKKQSLVFIMGIKGTREIPFELAPGDSANFWTPMDGIVETLREQGCKGTATIRARFKSAVGDEYLSKKFKIDLASV